MGAHRRGQETVLAFLWKCSKVFCALVVTAKRSVDELFMHNFRNLGFKQACTKGSIPGLRWGTFVPRPLSCPPWEKSCGRPCIPAFNFISKSLFAN